MKTVFIYIALWIGVSTGISLYIGNEFGPDEAEFFLPDNTTSGHHQIENQCHLCHDPYQGVKESACRDCHQADLDLHNDSHPMKKFQDPRNFERLKNIDATKCVTCHREHQPESTHSMGVSIPEDFCFHCHEDIAEERPNHSVYTFDTCATAGCHNFHDNTALYENFLVKNANQPDHLDNQSIDKIELKEYLTTHPRELNKMGLNMSDLESSELEPNAPEMKLTNNSELVSDWYKSAHASMGINCSHCHQSNGDQWIDNVTHENCKSCHEQEVSTFLEGKHGMRIKAGLPPMNTSLAKIPVHKTHPADLNCSTCHDPHKTDLNFASVDACLQCHSDDHSKNYQFSQHAKIWRDQDGESSQGASCATCHLPRTDHHDSDKWPYVNHNQNFNLRPNDKMIRSVCMSCHGLQFTLNNLSDPEVIKSNFSISTTNHVESIDLSVEKQRIKNN